MKWIQTHARKSKTKTQIFVAGVEDIKPLTTELNKIAEGNYQTKSLSNEQATIESRDSLTFITFIKMLTNQIYILELL